MGQPASLRGPATTLGSARFAMPSRSRSLPLLLVLAACSPEGAPGPGPESRAVPQRQESGASVEAVQATGATPAGPAAAAVDAAPGGPAAGAATPVDEGVQAAAAKIFAAVATDDLRAIATAPTELAKLGPAALPSIAHELARGGVPQRRVAALTLLQLGADAAPAVAALRAAARDPDQHVRAAAEHALRIATGDTSDLDRQRAQHEAAERRNQ